MSGDSKLPVQDEDGLQTYEYIVNNVETVDNQLDELAHIMRRADCTGQFLASTARFLAAVDRDRFQEYIGLFIEGALEKDRERKYIGSLLEAIWGADYMERADELKQTDNNFRRIFKRIYAQGAL